MMKRSIPLVLVLAFCMALPVGAGTVVWVTSARDQNADGVQDDKGWTDLLTSKGYTLDIQLGYWATLDAAKMAALNSASLIVVSRTANTGDYDDGTEPTQWNSLTTPILCLHSYMVRGTTSGNRRWKWVNSDAITNTAPMMEIVGTHPVFGSVQTDVLDETVGTGQTSFLATLDVGNGKLLAKAAGANLAWIVEWAPGVEYYTGAQQTAGGRRMLLAAGTQEVGATLQGAYNLTADGQKLFLNAVVYMIPEPATLALLGFGGLALLRRRKA